MCVVDSCPKPHSRAKPARQGALLSSIPWLLASKANRLKDDEFSDLERPTEVRLWQEQVFYRRRINSGCKSISVLSSSIRHNTRISTYPCYESLVYNLLGSKDLLHRR